jgi:hypothetical protein
VEAIGNIYFFRELIGDTVIHGFILGDANARDQPAVKTPLIKHLPNHPI